jgi:hypothetical protein
MMVNDTYSFSLPQDESMSPELLQLVLPLTFLGVCCLVGQIVVQSHRERIATEVWPHPPRRKRCETSKKLEVRRT